MGSRVNTREVRMRDQLLFERDALIKVNISSQITVDSHLHLNNLSRIPLGHLEIKTTVCDSVGLHQRKTQKKVIHSNQGFHLCIFSSLFCW